MRYIYNGRHLYHSVDGLQHLEPASQSVYNPHKYGLPELKKYPMPDVAHVKSAIKFFNYVSPKDERKLAQAILNRMREFGITDVNVGPDNRFGKYYKPDDTLQHSSGEWVNKKYTQKILNKDGTYTYIYPGMDPSQVGSRSMVGKNENMHSTNQGISKTPEQRHKDAVKLQNNLADTLKKSVSALGKAGSNFFNSASGTSLKGTNFGHVSGGSKSSGSSSGKGSSEDAASKKAAKAAKKESKEQKDYQKELQKMKEENKRKEEEQFKKRKQENEKRWAAEEERAEKMRDTSRQSVSKIALNEVLDMLKDSDKEYAKKILEGGRSKIDDYLDWLKESRKNNK